MGKRGGWRRFKEAAYYFKIEKMRDLDCVLVLSLF